MRKSNGNTFTFISHECYFSYHPLITAFESQSLITQELQHPCLILLDFHHSSPPLCKNHKQPEVDKKIQACETLTLSENFVFSLWRCSKQSVSRLLTLNWSEHVVLWVVFQISSGNNNTSLLLYACEAIYFTNKGVISPDVQEKGGIL